MRNSLVIGYGEVGQALHEVIGGFAYDSNGRFSTPNERYDFLHVCFPWNLDFVTAVRDYQARWLKPGGITVVHSSVPVGTSRLCGAAHSPVRGVHPHLAEGIRTFAKFVGALTWNDGSLIYEYLQSFGIHVRIAPSPEDTEAMKLCDTLQYGLAILAEKQIYDYCQAHGLDFDVVYTEANKTYNDGYRALGHPEYAKYVLRHVPGPIGGHCVIPNARLIDLDAAWYLCEHDGQVRRDDEKR